MYRTLYKINRYTPILMIWVEGNEKSQFYADRTEASWKRAGYTNVKRISGTTPDTLEGIFEFTKNRT